MMLYDVLKTSKGLYVDDSFAMLWGKQLGGWKTITGVLPLTFTAKGGNAVDWVIYGNDDNGTEQLFPFADIDFSYKYGQTDLHVWSDNGNLFMQGIVHEASTTAQVWKDNLSFTLPAGTYACNTISTLQYDFTIGRYIKKKSDNSNILGADSTSFTIAEKTEVYLSFYIYNATISTATQMTVTLIVGSTAPSHYIPYQQGVGEQRVDGYYVPLTISQQGQPDKTVDIYIGAEPLTEGETVSKASTGVDIELFEGENVISTTLYNKPTMKINYNGGN